jgi:hypothetical protein
VKGRHLAKRCTLILKNHQKEMLRKKWMRSCPKGWVSKLVSQNHPHNLVKDIWNNKEMKTCEKSKLKNLRSKEF